MNKRIFLSEELFGDNSELEDNMNIPHNEKLEKLASECRNASLLVKQLENQLKDAKAAKVRIEQVVIPDAMAELGASSITLPSGTSITVKPYINAREAKDSEGKLDRDKQQILYQWLIDAGHGGLVKKEFAIYTNDADIIQTLMDACKEMGLDYEYITQTIHWGTFQKWVKEQLELGQELPTNLFDLYVGSIAVVK